MKFKLDENLGRSALAAFEETTYYVSSVHFRRVRWPA